MTAVVAAPGPEPEMGIPWPLEAVDREARQLYHEPYLVRQVREHPDRSTDDGKRRRDPVGPSRA